MKNFTKVILLFLISSFFQTLTHAQISGNKTIGGTSPDYATINDAVTALKTSGINGNVTFNIRDGIYNEKLDISGISGSQTYTILFQSESQDTSKVKIAYTATGGNTYLLNLTQIKNITFKNLSFKFSGNYTCRMVNMYDSVVNVKFQGNNFKCLNTSAYIMYAAQPQSGTKAPRMLEFSNNTFDSGYSAIELYGGYYGIVRDLTITNNLFKNQKNNGVYLSSCEGISIKSNTVSSITGTNNDVYAFGIGLEYAKDFEITENKLYTSFCYGISLKDCSNTSILKRAITNNFVTTKIDPYGMSGEALDVKNTSYADIIHNTLRLIGGNTGMTSYGLSVTGSSNINVVNNIMHNNETFAVNLDSKTGITTWDYNYLSGNSTYFARYNSTSYNSLSTWQTASSLDAHSVTGAITFVSNSDLHMNSPVVNDKGTPWQSVTKDIDNETRSLTKPDMGADEFSIVNHAPVIANQTFTLNENAANGTAVGTVSASDPDAGQTLTYSITAGNSLNAFAINSSTGAITVNTASVLNFEATPSFSLTVNVQDNATTALSASATITVNLSDVNEAPIMNNQTFSIAENNANGTAVGTVSASDPDAGQTLTYSITAGNASNAFSINSSTGAITVNTASALNFETTPSFSLTVKVQDNGTASLSASATITVNLSDVNEAPVMNNQTFSIAENVANGTAVGTVSASDPDAGQTLTYSITAGNTSEAFAINSSTGAITINTASALNFEITSSFSLTVKVQDNASTALSASATVTINLTNANEAPVITNQSFTINEKSANGTQAGTVTASDPDAGQILTYSITGGNTLNAFAINSSTGVITVATSSVLIFDTNPSFALTVKVQDNGTNSLSASATVTINLSKVTGIQSLLAGESTLVYPNPSNGIIHIKKEYLSGNKIDFQVYDMTGRLLFSQKNVSETITLPDITGQINVRIFVNDQVYTQKLIIKK